MKFYDKQEAIETLEAILLPYDKKTLSEALSSLAVSSLKSDGAISFKNIDEITLIKQNGKYAVKIGNEE
jgi:hypothetical protein